MIYSCYSAALFSSISPAPELNTGNIALAETTSEVYSKHHALENAVNQKPEKHCRVYVFSNESDWYCMISFMHISFHFLPPELYTFLVHAMDHPPPGNPFAHLEKVQRPPCDIYLGYLLENVVFDWFNR